VNVQYVGRVGGLAIALGIGAAIGQGCAVASADDAGASSARQHGQAGSSRNSTRPRAVSVTSRQSVASKRIVVAPRLAKAGVQPDPSAPVPTPTLDPVLFAAAQSGRHRFGAAPAAAQPAASTPTGTWVDIITNNYDKIYQTGIGSYLGQNAPYGEDLTSPTGILDAAYNYTGDGEAVLSASFRYAPQPFTAPVWNWTKADFDLVPSTDLDMYLVKIDPTTYAIVGVHTLTPESIFTVKYDGIDPVLEYVGIAVREGTVIGEFDGVPDIPPIKPGDPGDPGNPGPGPGDGVALTPPVLTTRYITSHSIELVPDKEGSQDTRVVGYNIYRDGVKVNGKLVSTVLIYTDEDLDADVTYNYTARSVDASGKESLDSNALSVTTYSEAEKPGFAQRLRNKMIDLFVPDENGQNNPFEVFIETTRNVVSIVPGAGLLFAAVTIPFDLVQLVLAAVQGDGAGVSDEAKDLGHDLVSAIGIVNSLKFLKAVSESL
jgi:hypothetical protein